MFALRLVHVFEGAKKEVLDPDLRWLYCTIAHPRPWNPLFFGSVSLATASANSAMKIPLIIAVVVAAKPNLVGLLVLHYQRASPDDCYSNGDK